MSPSPPAPVGRGAPSPGETWYHPGQPKQPTPQPRATPRSYRVGWPNKRKARLQDNPQPKGHLVKLESFPGYPVAGLPAVLQVWATQQQAVAEAKADAARSKLVELPNGSVTHNWTPRPTVRPSWPKVVAPPLPVVRPAAGKVFQRHVSTMALEVREQRFLRPALHPLARLARAQRVQGRV